MEEGLENGVGKAWESRWKMTEKEALAEAEASFSWVVGGEGKGAILSRFQIWECIWIFSLGIHLWKFGNSKSGNEGVDGKGVKVRIFSV